MAVQKIEWFQPGKNHDPDAVSDATATDFTGHPSLTQEHLAPATEMDSIMRRFFATGEMPRARHVAEYGDFNDVTDLRTMLLQIEVGKKAFASVPSSIRARFDNDPGAFLEWIHDDRNYNEAAELGLVPGLNPVESAAVRAAAAPAAPRAASGPEVSVAPVAPDSSSSSSS